MDKECINYLRLTSVNQIKTAKSGHPGICLGAAPILFSIYKNAFFNPKMPDYFNRDRIVFSAGHASALIYACLHLFGFDLTVEDLKKFRQLNSKTPGHPEVNITPGIDVSTGPLGQGISNAVGFAIAEQYLGAYFNKKQLKIVDHFTYCFCSDGCIMEGVAQEAISIAGNLKLNKLILFYDKNDITIDGKLDLSNTENIKLKFLATNWNVLEVENGNDFIEIEKSLKTAQKSDKPTVIIVKTQIGFGSELVNTNKIHGKPLEQQQVDVLRQNLDYFVPDWEILKNVKEYIRKTLGKKQERFFIEQKNIDEYKQKFPDKFKEFKEFEKNIKFNFKTLIKDFNQTKFDGREELHKILNILYDFVPNLMGGNADVALSTRAFFEKSDYFSFKSRLGRNIPFGVRESAMAGISNGIALHGGLKTFCSTFFSFENYLTPALRLSALMNVGVLYLFTHDSISTGEDGPTHQPAEQLATLRAMPRLCVFRPAGRSELLAGLQIFFDKNIPLAILLSRQTTEFVKDNFDEALKGGYILSKVSDFVGTLVSTGSEIELCLNAQKILLKENIKINVVSMPSVEMFENQSKSYKNKVIDRTKPVFCVEASSDNIWYKFATDEENVFKMNSFGKSGKGKDIQSYLGFSPENIAFWIKKRLDNK